MTKASKTVSAAFQQTDSTVVLLPLPEETETLLPNWDKLKAYYTAVYAKMEKGEIRSASVVKRAVQRQQLPGCVSVIGLALPSTMLAHVHLACLLQNPAHWW